MKDDYEIDKFLELDADTDGEASGETPVTLDDLLGDGSAFERALWSDMEFDLDSDIDDSDASPGFSHNIELDADLDDTAPLELGSEMRVKESEEEEAPQMSAEELAVFIAKRRKRQRVLVIIAVIAWAAAILIFMFARGIGPFSRTIPAEEKPEAPADSSVTTPPLEEARTMSWVTAGKDYQDLYKLINKQTFGIKNAGIFGEDVTANLGDPGTIAPFSGSDINPPGTAGSGYGQDIGPLDDIDSGEDPDFGIDPETEADIVKTDGEYIYAINSKNFVIVKADKGEMEVSSRIPQPAPDEGQVYFEMYILGDRLIAIRHGYNLTALPDTQGRDALSETCIAYPLTGYITDTSIDIFDISDRAAPKKLHTLSQSGDYNSSRMVDGYLYLITTYYGDIWQMDGSDPRTFIPLYARDGEQYKPDESDIYLPPGTVWPCFTVISGIDVFGDGGFISNKSVYGDAGTIYISPDALYLAHTSSGEGKEDVSSEVVKYIYSSETIISKLLISSGQVIPSAQAGVPGYALNQFSLDEYAGILRIVTTQDYSVRYGFKDTNRNYTREEWDRLPAGSFDSVNALYTLDKDLKLLGCIEDLAPGERVYSCRFIEETAYFATFRPAEPLFSVDLSNPASPQVIGALKIPGFSEYLHPYSEGRLFGLGRDTDESTGAWKGLKLTMFDNSNPGDVQEIHTLQIGNEYSAAEHNHKAILVSSGKALIAFPADGKYLIYGYSETSGFSKIADVQPGGGELWNEIRGLFIGGTFYIVGPNSVNAYGIDEGFAELGTLKTDEGASSINRWIFSGGVVPIMPLVG